VFGSEITTIVTTQPVAKPVTPPETNSGELTTGLTSALRIPVMAFGPAGCA